MLKIILPFLFAVNAAAGTYTTDLLLYKPAARDTNYVAPFATGMDTLDAAIPDKRINKTATIKSTWTITSSFTVTGASSLASATMSGPLTLAGSSLTVTGNAFSVGGSTLSVQYGNVAIGRSAPVTGRKLEVAASNIYVDSGYGLETNDSNIKIQSDANNNASASSVTIRAGSTTENDRVVAEFGANSGGGYVTFPGSGFTVGGSTLAVSGGKVGISTANPSEALSVVGNSKISSNQAESRSWYTSPGDGIFQHKLGAVVESQIAYAGGDSWLGATGGTVGLGSKFFLKGSSGFVGIGTVSPTHTLQVNGSLGAVGIDASSVTVTGSGSAFTSTTSTVTFAGWADVGFMISTTSCAGVSYAQAACPAGYRAISVGCNMQTTPARMFGLTTGTSNTCNVSAGLATTGETPTAGICYTPTTEGIEVYTHCARLK